MATWHEGTGKAVCKRFFTPPEEDKDGKKKKSVPVTQRKSFLHLPKLVVGPTYQRIFVYTKGRGACKQHKKFGRCDHEDCGKKDIRFSVKGIAGTEWSWHPTQQKSIPPAPFKGDPEDAIHYVVPCGSYDAAGIMDYLSRRVGAVKAAEILTDLLTASPA